MTCCIGMMCSDGVIVAADTQESYGGEKSYVSKMFPLTGDERKAVVAGAGASLLIDYAADRIFSDVITPQCHSISDVQAGLQKLMDDLYGKEFEKYPAEKVDKDIQLLVAGQFRKEFPFLFSIDSTLVRSVHGVRVLGVGTLSAMAADFHRMHLIMPQAAWACIYLLKIAKERYEGVGGTTQLIGITGDGEMKFERTWDISQKEQALGRLDAVSRRLLIGMVPATAPSMFQATLASTADVLRVTRNELERLDREFERQAKLDRAITDRAKNRVEKAAAKMQAKQSASQKSKPTQ